MRLDKYIANLWYWSRREVLNYIKNWDIIVNDTLVTQKDAKINFWDKIQVWDYWTFEYQEFIYIMLNKPTDYVSSKKDDWWHISYLNLLDDCVYWNIINIVWRLDFDTTGLLFLTNDWELTHNIIHPKKEIFKKYKVTSKNTLSKEDIKKLETWVKIDDFITKPAFVEIIDENNIYLSICEGKFHQIKKMLEAVDNEVIALHRQSIWWLDLWILDVGSWKYLTKDEIDKIFL